MRFAAKRASSCSAIKAELTFEPYSSMKGIIYSSHLRNLKIQTEGVCAGNLNSDLYTY